MKPSNYNKCLDCKYHTDDIDNTCYRKGGIWGESLILKLPVKTCCYYKKRTYMDELKQLTANKICFDIKNKNLCDNCKKEFAICDGQPSFGNGRGNDNVIRCEQFIKKC